MRPTTVPPPSTSRPRSGSTASTAAGWSAPAPASRRAATIAEARDDPSSIFSATVVPSGAVITWTPSAPNFENTPRRSITTESGRPGPERVVSAAETVRQALSELPVDQRVTVVLVDGEGFDHREAAEILGVAPGTVASRLHRARAALRRVLGEEVR